MRHDQKRSIPSNVNSSSVGDKTLKLVMLSPLCVCSLGRPYSQKQIQVSKNSISYLAILVFKDQSTRRQALKTHFRMTLQCNFSLFYQNMKLRGSSVMYTDEETGKWNRVGMANAVVVKTRRHLESVSNL